MRWSEAVPPSSIYRGWTIEVTVRRDARGEWLGEWPDGLHHQFGQRLLDLGADDLQQRYFRARRSTATKPIQEAQIGDLERLQLDLQARNLVAKPRVLEQGPAILDFTRGERFQFLFHLVRLNLPVNR